MRSGLITEATVVGGSLFVVGAALMQFRQEGITDKKYWPYLGVFITGFSAHLIFEAFGLNKKYCDVAFNADPDDWDEEIDWDNDESKKDDDLFGEIEWDAESKDEARMKKYEKTYGKEGAKVRNRIFKRILAKAQDGTKAGQWSARKAQSLTEGYEKAMKGKGKKAYKGGKKTKSQKSLKKWGDQKWTTKSGKKSSKTGERYLPEKAIKALSDKEYKETSDKKRKDTKKGKQFSKQPKKVADKVKKYRAEYDWDTEWNKRRSEATWKSKQQEPKEITEFEKEMIWVENMFNQNRYYCKRYDDIPYLQRKTFSGKNLRRGNRCYNCRSKECPSKLLSWKQAHRLADEADDGRAKRWGVRDELIESGEYPEYLRRDRDSILKDLFGAEGDIPYGVHVESHKTTSTVFYKRKPFRKYRGNRHREQAQAYASFMESKLKRNPRQFNYYAESFESETVAFESFRGRWNVGQTREIEGVRVKKMRNGAFKLDFQGESIIIYDGQFHQINRNDSGGFSMGRYDSALNGELLRSDYSEKDVPDNMEAIIRWKHRVGGGRLVIRSPFKKARHIFAGGLYHFTLPGQGYRGVFYPTNRGKTYRFIRRNGEPIVGRFPKKNEAWLDIRYDAETLGAESFDAEDETQAYLMCDWNKKVPYELHNAGCKHRNFYEKRWESDIDLWNPTSLEGVCRDYIQAWEENLEGADYVDGEDLDAIAKMTFSQFMRSDYTKTTTPIKLSPCHRDNPKIKEFMDNNLVGDISPLTYLRYDAEEFEAEGKPTSVEVKRSTNDEKKLMAVFTYPDERTKTTHFGQRGASDYTKHGEKERMERYLERHGGGTTTSTKEDWNDPTTAGALSRWILWNKPSLSASFNDFKRRFNLKGDLKVSKSAESFDAQFTPSQELSDYTPEEIVESSAIDGFQPSKFSVMGNRAESFEADSCRECGRKEGAYSDTVLIACQGCPELSCQHCLDEENNGCAFCIKKRAESTTKRLNLVMMGVPGSGKGTQSKLITKKYGWPQIGMGDLIRDNMRRKTPLGVKCEPYMAKGSLVPDEIMIELVSQRLKEDDCKNGFILDGFPRTVPQGKALEKITNIDAVFFLDTKKELVIERLGGRRTCSDCGEIYHQLFQPPQQEGTCDLCKGELFIRPDDNPKTISNRLSVFKTKTQPLIDFYEQRNLLRPIQSNSTPQDVFESIDSDIQSMLVSGDITALEAQDTPYCDYHTQLVLGAENRLIMDAEHYTGGRPMTCPICIKTLSEY